MKRLPRYRLITGADDATFGHRVSRALELGYALYGNPAVAHDGQGSWVAQAVVWPGELPPFRPPGEGSREVP